MSSAGANDGGAGGGDSYGGGLNAPPEQRVEAALDSFFGDIERAEDSVSQAQRDASRNLKKAVVAGGGTPAGGFASDMEQRSWDIDAGYVPTPIEAKNMSPEEQVGYGREAFTRAFQADNPYSQAQLEAIRDDSVGAFGELGKLQQIQSNTDYVGNYIGDQYGNVFGENLGPLARYAVNAVTPVSIEGLFKGTAALEGLLGHPSGFNTPDEVSQMERDAMAVGSGIESGTRGERGGLSGAIASTLGSTSKPATQAIVEEEYPTLDNVQGKYKALMPTIKLKGRTLADILAEV